jgi:hypothetical protein
MSSCDSRVLWMQLASGAAHGPAGCMGFML